MEAFFSEFGLKLTYFLIIVAAAGAILAPLVTTVLNNPKALIYTGGAIALLAIVYFIGVGMETGEAKMIGGQEVSESLSRNVGGALKMMYILIFVAIGGIVYTEIAKFFR
ncbi:MAG: hypothetical protein ACFCUI_06415 [Bernardetiaceae bacterium]